MVKLTFSRQMNSLLSNKALNSSTMGSIGAAAVQVTIGTNKIAPINLNKKQGTWAPLAKSTLNDPAKTDKRKFVRTGAVLKALSTEVDKTKLMQWGTENDIYAKNSRRSKRYRAGGIFAQVSTFATGFTVLVGFNGRARISAAFNKKRKALAIEKGLNVKGMKSSQISKAVNSMVSVEDVQKSLGKRSGIKKYSVSKANKKGVTNNLFYANIVQGGGKGKGKPRELMPYTATDTTRLQKAIADQVQKIFKKVEKG